MQDQLRPIGITIGDAAGIGPEIVVKALLSAAESGVRGPFVIYGYLDVIRAAFRRYGAIDGVCELASCVWNAPEMECAPRPAISLREQGSSPSSAIRICNLAPVSSGGKTGGHPAPSIQIGQISAEAGNLAFQAVRAAALDATAGRLRAVVTAPLSKAAMNLAGHVYPGHTEILAELAGGVPVRMMLANPSLRTVLVSIHLPLVEAIRTLSTDGILETIRLTDAFLKRTGIAAPRIAVAGLNPHAGEGGLIGREDIEIIAPAVEAARTERIDASGPWAPDTVFMRARGFAEFDVVIAMYHDQALIPVKYLGLDDGVNLTVGLPYVRTSPDHGTAFDIAGKGVADPASMLAALRMADELSRCASDAP